MEDDAGDSILKISCSFVVLACIFVVKVGCCALAGATSRLTKDRCSIFSQLLRIAIVIHETAHLLLYR